MKEVQKYQTFNHNLCLSRRDFLKTTGALGITVGLSPLLKAASNDKPKKMNIVIITTDDNDAESLGCFGCQLPDITPNMDALASKGFRFEHAHACSPTCQPCRLSLMTGRYPQTNGAVGHGDPIRTDVPTLAMTLKKAGYYTAIVGKIGNYLPYPSFDWSKDKDSKGGWLSADTWDDTSDGYWSMWRSPEGFYKGTKELVSDAKKQEKQFFLHLNTSDPHRPWPGSVDEVNHMARMSNSKRRMPSLRPYPKNYSPWEVPVPPYLPDLAGVRVDVAQYYSGLHNADKAVGRILDALKEEGVYEDTIIICFGDQGASLPTSKQNLYRYSTRIPLIIRWPGMKEGAVIDKTMVSVIDIMPTILDSLDIEVKDMDGQSILPLLEGKTDSCREYIQTSYNYALPGVQAFPMRAVQNKEYLYIFNSWCGESNINPKGRLFYNGEPLNGLCWKSMVEAARSDKELKKRVDFIEQRVPEEFYDLTKDPFCLNNLISDPSQKDRVQSFKKLVENQMIETNDPLLEKFKGTGPIPPEWLTFTEV